MGASMPEQSVPILILRARAILLAASTGGAGRAAGLIQNGFHGSHVLPSDDMATFLAPNDSQSVLYALIESPKFLYSILLPLTSDL